MVVTDDLRRRLQQEHRCLRLLQEDLLESFESWCEDPTPAHLEGLSRVFEDFSKSLERHFDLEEDGGYLGFVTQRRPHHSAAAKQLLDDHGEIRRLMRQLREDMAREPNTPGSEEHMQLRKDFVALLKEFGRHEQAERELVMEVFWLDGGYSS